MQDYEEHPRVALLISDTDSIRCKALPQWCVGQEGVWCDGADTHLVHTELTHRVLRVMHRRKECAIEELMQECSSYAWNQVLLEIDRLSRSGELCLLYKKDGDYAVRLPRAA